MGVVAEVRLSNIDHAFIYGDWVTGERASRWARNHIAGLGVEEAVMTGADKLLALGFVMNGTEQMGALLAISMIGAIFQADEKGGVVFAGIVKLFGVSRGELVNLGNCNGVSRFWLGKENWFDRRRTRAGCRSEAGKFRKLASGDPMFFGLRNRISFFPGRIVRHR